MRASFLGAAFAVLALIKVTGAADNVDPEALTSCYSTAIGPAVADVHFSWIGTNRDTGNTYGSGFLISNGGKVLTDLHVVRPEVPDGVPPPDVSSYSIQLRFGDALKGQGHQARILKTYPQLDLAILQLDEPAKGISPLDLGPYAKLAVGSTLRAFGFPDGNNLSLTPPGAVSSQSAVVAGQLQPHWLQTTLPIVHGDSGGPVFDDNGIVVAVSSAELGSDHPGISYITPLSEAGDILKEVVGSNESGAPCSVEALKARTSYYPWVLTRGRSADGTNFVTFSIENTDSAGRYSPVDQGDVITSRTKVPIKKGPLDFGKILDGKFDIESAEDSGTLEQDSERFVAYAAYYNVYSKSDDRNQEWAMIFPDTPNGIHDAIRLVEDQNLKGSHGPGLWTNTNHFDTQKPITRGEFWLWTGLLLDGPPSPPSEKQKYERKDLAVFRHIDPTDTTAPQVGDVLDIGDNTWLYKRLDDAMGDSINFDAEAGVGTHLQVLQTKVIGGKVFCQVEIADPNSY